MTSATADIQRLYSLAAEKANRDLDALSLYEPLPFQDMFHRCRTKECVLQKGNRAGGEQPLTSIIFTPTGRTTMGEVQAGDTVLGGDGLPCQVEEVIEYGDSPVYRFIFSDGTTCEAGENHKWTCRLGGPEPDPEQRGVEWGGWQVYTSLDIALYFCGWPFDSSIAVYFPVVKDRSPVVRRLAKIEYVGVKPCRCINVNNPSRTYLTDEFIVTHNSIAGFAEDARAVLNRDPYKKYRNRQGQKVLLLLGFGVTHVGTVIYPKLFLEGAFNIIRDERTKQWRVFKPWQEYDEAYKEKARPAPPLIPPRMVIPKTWNWDAKSAGIFKSVELKTGWKIWCFPSSGDPRQAQGFNVDLAHIDEDIEQPGWYTEIIARLGEVHGFLRWTAMPHMANEVLLKIIQRGREQEGEPEDKRTTTIVRASVEDNPYFPKDELERNKRIWRDEGEDVYRMRMHGELTYDSVLCYPSFREEVHTISLHDLPDGRVPSNWCRYMVVDPGHAKMGVLYAAIDPEEKFVTIYDEIRPVQCDAEFLASTVAQRNRGQHFHAFIIDDHGSRRTNAGTGTTDREEYVKAFKKYGIRSHITGHDFIPGSDDVMGRQNVVRQWLRPRENGLPPRLRIVRECCPQLIKEFKKFRKKQQYGVTIDDPQYRGETDVIVCLEYLAAFGPTYVAPKPPNATYDAYERFLAERRRKARGALGGAAVYF